MRQRYLEVLSARMLRSAPVPPGSLDRYFPERGVVTAVTDGGRRILLGHGPKKAIVLIAGQDNVATLHLFLKMRPAARPAAVASHFGHFEHVLLHHALVTKRDTARRRAVECRPDIFVAAIRGLEYRPMCFLPGQRQDPLLAAAKGSLECEDQHHFLPARYCGASNNSLVTHPFPLPRLPLASRALRAAGRRCN